MSRVSRVRRHKAEIPELNITTFLNLMVILIPFLLISAVFSQMTILELNLPPSSKQNPDDQKKKKDINFELIVRHNEMIVADTLGGVIKTFKKSSDGSYDMKSLSDLLVKIKDKFPKKETITILLEPNIPYDILVQAMDTVRVISVVEDEEVVLKELFGKIAIGDAPPVENTDAGISRDNKP